MASLEGRRVLIVEDEPIVALMLEEMLQDQRCTPIGPALTVDEGLRLLEGGMPDAAILDLNVAGTRSYPIAEILQRHGVPFVFATGYSDQALDAAYRTIPALVKPFDEHVLIATLAGLLPD